MVGAIASIPVEAHWLICIGQNEVRRKIAVKFDANGANRGSPFWPHNETVVPSNSTVGEGTFIAAGVVIGPRVTIGRHCILQPGCLLGHDVIVHDYAFVGGRAMLAGFVIVEEGAVVSNVLWRGELLRRDGGHQKVARLHERRERRDHLRLCM